MTDIYHAIIRTVAAYLLALAAARLMGRKVVSQMTFFDFCVAVTLGSITSRIGLSGIDSFQTAVAMLVTLCLLVILTDYLRTKSMRFIKAVTSEPLVLIENNRIVQGNMKKAKMTLTDLTSLLREKDVFSIVDVQYAILECDGKLSVLMKTDQKPVTPSELQLHPPEKGLTKDIVVDGKILNENLESTNMTETWLHQELRKQGINKIGEVFYAALDSSGSLYVSKKVREKEESGKHGIE